MAGSAICDGLAKVLGPDHEESLESHLAPASSRAILVRMLTNLKAIYLTRNERARAHLAVDRVASLLPNIAGPLVERGLLALKLKEDFADYNALSRESLTEVVRRHAQELLGHIFSVMQGEGVDLGE